MHFRPLLIIGAISYRCTAGPVEETSLMDLNGHVTPPMNLTSIQNITTAGNIGRCSLNSLYCFKQIVKDFGYPIDQLIYQYCRDVGDNDPDCRTCATTGCVCAADCLRAVFQCADDKGWYSYTGSCPHNRCAVGECL
ncbi:hypothetical protein HBI70_099060 [Parastagonospora nodorum]|nr:hypothetical protein HBH52_004840 [Parastagonospora nodorum]KAH4101343.1 hypothetical protein HBH46_138220 [Parastagonospora nodorum]KAH4265048.1 hypothetical protein HBI03_081500 [Parastagonospora nodorum]KAH4283190.1 hypothetical protein HBI04_019920 [Parastagonospora nodorum]KAH5062456.1 hypothetical protein HBH96_065470 [Parastagonospora nodorum]